MCTVQSNFLIETMCIIANGRLPIVAQFGEIVSLTFQSGIKTNTF